MKLRFALSLSAALFCLMLAVAPAHADVLYNNGPGSQFLTMWDISGTNALSNQFTCNFGGCNTQYLEFDATFPGDYSAQHVNWSVTSAPFGGTTFASGTSTLPQFFVCDSENIVCLLDINMVTSLSQGTYYVNLGGVDGPLEWDTTSNPLNGNNAYYMSNGIMSQIQGEGFLVRGTSTPEPASFMLLGSGLLGLAGLLRRGFLL